MYTTKVIVLQKKPFRAQDRMFTLYTENRGKIQALCRGGQKITSKMAPHLEPFTLAEVMIASGSMLHHIASARSQETFPHLRNTLTGIRLGGTFLQLVHIFTREEDPESYLFPLLSTYLTWLDGAIRTKMLRHKSQIEDAASSFIWQLFTSIGLSPDMKRCIHGSHRLQGETWLDTKHGGCVCSTHQTVHPADGLVSITEQDRHILQKLQNISLKAGALWPLSGQIKKVINVWYHWQREHHTDFIPFGLEVGRKTNV